jgi:hypothetical protein
MRNTREMDNASMYEVPLTGRRRKRDAANSLKFLANIEGVTDYDGHVRGANGIRWRVA